MVRRGCVLASWLAEALHQVSQREQIDMIVDVVDGDDITRLQRRDMRGRLTLAETTSRVGLSCP
jgi:hypothetical protein